MLSDRKLIEELMNICSVFYTNDSIISKDVIDKSTKLINFIEYCNENSIEISGNVILEIMKFINIINHNVKRKHKLLNLETKE